jgi:hypothetical protein
VIGQTLPRVASHSSIVACSKTRPEERTFTGSFITWPLMAHKNSAGMAGSDFRLSLLAFPSSVSLASATGGFFCMNWAAAPDFPFSTLWSARERATAAPLFPRSPPRLGRSPSRRNLLASEGSPPASRLDPSPPPPLDLAPALSCFWSWREPFASCCCA